MTGREAPSCRAERPRKDSAANVPQEPWNCPGEPSTATKIHGSLVKSQTHRFLTINPAFTDHTSMLNGIARYDHIKIHQTSAHSTCNDPNVRTSTEVPKDKVCRVYY